MPVYRRDRHLRQRVGYLRTINCNKSVTLNLDRRTLFDPQSRHHPPCSVPILNYYTGWINAEAARGEITARCGGVDALPLRRRSGMVPLSRVRPSCDDLVWRGGVRMPALPPTRL